MKCARPKPEVSSSAKTKFYSGKGGTGGEKSFPQAELSSMRSVVKRRFATPQKAGRASPGLPAGATKAKKSSEDVYKTIVATQKVVQRLNWSAGKISNFIARKFQGRRLSQLSDKERTDLLYYLQLEHLKESSATYSEMGSRPSQRIPPTV